MKLTKWVAAAQLRLLRVLAVQLVTNAVQQLHVALLRLLLERVDEGVRQSASCLAGNLSVGSVEAEQSACL